MKFRSLKPVDDDRVADELEHLPRRPAGTGRTVPAQDVARRAAAAVQHPARRHEPGRSASGAPALRRPVRRALHRLRRPAPGALRPDRAGRRSTACAATPRSTSAPGSTTSTSRTGRSGSTSRSSCAPRCPSSRNRVRSTSELGHTSHTHYGRNRPCTTRLPADRATTRRDIPVVILCGGMGTRLREASEKLPKPLVDIGGKPILWHIMKTYSALRLPAVRPVPGLQGRPDPALLPRLPRAPRTTSPSSSARTRRRSSTARRTSRTGRSPSSRPAC